jgi:hypothetical protein
MLLDMRNPIFSACVLMMRQVRRPTPFNHALRPGTVYDHLIRETTRFRHDKQIQRVLQVPVVDDGVGVWVCRRQLNAPATPLVEQEIAHGECVFAVDREVFVLLWAAVELGVPELHVGLGGEETHGVPPILAGGVAPQL